MKSRPLNRRNLIVLAVVPIGLCVLAAGVRGIQGPYYLATNSDPAYAYLLNSLNVLSLNAPQHIDHPGTTVQTLGAFVIAVCWLATRFASGGPNVEEAVLADPERYLSAINAVLVVLIAVTAFAVGLKVLRAWGLLPALTMQVSLLLFTQVPIALPKVTPEPLLIVVSLALLATLLPIAMSGEEPDAGSRLRPVLAGAVMGVGVATKFTFVPLLGFILLLHGWKRRAVALLACALSFVLFTIPVWVHYRNMFGWLRSLATHTGINGGGDSGVPDLSSLAANLSFVFSVGTPLFILLAFYLALALALSTRLINLSGAQLGGIRRLLLVTSLVIATQIAVTAKNPGAHYLLPAMVVTGLASAAIVRLVVQAPMGLLTQFCRFGAVAALLAGVIVAGTRTNDQVTVLGQYAYGVSASDGQPEVVSAIIIDYFGSSSQAYALAFGNDFAGRRYGRDLGRMYPEARFYEIWTSQFYSFAGVLSDEDIARLISSDPEVLLRGLSLEGGMATYRERLLLEPVLVGSNPALYRLIGIRPSY